MWFRPPRRILLVVALVLGATEASAQQPAAGQEEPAGETPPAPPAPPPPAPSPEEVEARRLFAEAEGLRKTGSCERAAVLYLKSRALFPSVANTLNAAVCLAKVEREDEALELYQELVGRMRDQLQADELAAIGPEMQRLRSLLGTVDVAGDVGATLVIDGRSRGTLPLAGPIPIRPGAHDVRVLKEGFEVWSTAVDAKVGQVTALRATLKPLGASGRLVVTGPTGGELLVDGAPLGQLPFDGVLGPGPHVVQVVAGDSGSALQPIVVAAGQRTALSPPIGPLGGRLELVTEPHTAALIIDGVAVWSGRWRGRLPVGKQRIEAEEEGYHRAVQELVVDVTDEARRITLTLERDESHPRWAAAAPSGAFFVEALGGPALAPSLGSSAEATCSEVACEAGVPLGYTFGLRGGYELPIRLSFELEGGFFAMNRSLSRSTPLTVPTGADPLAVTYTFDDALRLRGGFVMGGVGYRLPVAGPFAVRAHALLGLMFLRARDAATGTASAAGEEAPLLFSRPDEPALALNLLVAPEIDFDLDFDGLVFGLGIATKIILLGGPGTELGDVYVDAACDPASPSVGCAPGRDSLRDEVAYGTVVAIVPNLHVGYRF